MGKKTKIQHKTNDGVSLLLTIDKIVAEDPGSTFIIKVEGSDPALPPTDEQLVNIQQEMKKVQKRHPKSEFLVITNGLKIIEFDAQSKRDNSYIVSFWGLPKTVSVDKNEIKEIENSFKRVGIENITVIPNDFDIELC